MPSRSKRRRSRSRDRYDSSYSKRRKSDPISGPKKAGYSNYSRRGRRGVPSWSNDGEMRHFDAVCTKAALPVGSIAATAWDNSVQNPTRVGTELDNWAGDNLCSPKLGSAYYNRENKQIAVWNIKARIHVVVPADSYNVTTDPAETFRIAIVADKQAALDGTNGSLVFRNIGNQCNGICFWQNDDEWGRFRVLYDKTYTLQNPTIGIYDIPPQTIVQSGLEKYIKVNIKFKKPLIIKFNNTNSGILNSVVENSLHFMIKRANTSTEPGLDVDYCIRTSYRG